MSMITNWIGLHSVVLPLQITTAYSCQLSLKQFIEILDTSPSLSRKMLSTLLSSFPCEPSATLVSFVKPVSFKPVAWQELSSSFGWPPKLFTSVSKRCPIRSIFRDFDNWQCPSVLPEKTWYHWLQKKSWITTDNEKTQEKRTRVELVIPQIYPPCSHTRAMYNMIACSHGRVPKMHRAPQCRSLRHHQQVESTRNLLYLLQSEWIFGNLFIGLVDAFADEMFNSFSFFTQCLFQMVQRLTYRRRLSYNTRSNRKRMWVVFYPLTITCSLCFVILLYFCNINRFQHSFSLGAICSSKTPGKFVFNFISFDSKLIKLVQQYNCVVI